MVLIPKPFIPRKCPKCGKKLSHVNALDTPAKLYMVYCSDPKCRFVRDWYKEEMLCH